MHESTPQDSFRLVPSLCIDFVFARLFGGRAKTNSAALVGQQSAPLQLISDPVPLKSHYLVELNFVFLTLSLYR